MAGAVPTSQVQLVVAHEQTVYDPDRPGSQLNLYLAQDIADLYWSLKGYIEGKEDCLVQQLKQFVTANEYPVSSPNLKSVEPDPIDCFFSILQNSTVQSSAELLLLLLKALKVLSRKQDNRVKFGENGILAVLVSLAPPLNSRIAAEGANVLLNICYEPENVQALLRTPGVKQLSAFLLDDDEDVQANAAGAIQSVSFQAEGRQHVREIGGVENLLDLLLSPNTKVLGRAAGAVHNLSSDAECISIIRAYGGIPKLVQLLSSDHVNIAGSAAGALQNISREVASRLLIRELDAVPPLANLLSCSDLPAQVCAAGALLNILGPELDGRPQDGEGQARRAFGKMMSLIMALAVVHEGVFERAPALE